MQQVVEEMVGPLNQVVQDAAIGGGSDAVGDFLGIGGGDGMGIGANSADSLGDLLGIEGITASQDHLKSPKHLSDALGIHNDIVGDGRFDIEVTFNAGQGAKFNFHDTACSGWFNEPGVRMQKKG